jgi:branched-chain amino acid transport system ATP-binding protein
MKILDINSVSRRFGGLQALSEISFTVTQGKIIGLIGPNGAGKTTFFNALVGLVRPDRGEIRLDGRNIVGLKPHQIVELGMTKTFQNVALFPESTVLENVLTAGLLRHELSTARQTAMQCLHRVGLSAIANKRAGDVSLPERARVELARSLCTEPRVLLLDEVMASLNPIEMQEIMALIRSLRDSGLTVLVVEHHMRTIMAICDRILVLNFGRLIADGTPKEVAADGAVIEAYLGRTLEKRH